MSNKIKKIITVLIILFISFNFIFPRIILAEDSSDTSDKENMFNTMKEEFDTGILGTAIDGIIGVLTWKSRVTSSTFVIILQVVLTGIFNVTKNETEPIFELASPNLILFNKLKILDVNFFNDDESAGAGIQGLRDSIAKWYYALRNIALAASIVVLIYIGIRMALSTVASDKAVYKRMLTDWLVSFVLVFILHYIMLAIVSLSDGLVNIIDNVGEGALHEEIFANVETSLTLKMFSPFLSVGITATIINLLLIGVTLALFVMYMKRMLTIAFLTIIAPLVTITYSIDKLKDGQAQALNVWLKEYSYNILIQPFHCIIYYVFVSTSVGNMLTAGTISITSSILAIMCIMFIFKAEDIIRNIFGFSNSKSLGTGVAAGALVGSAIGKATELGKVMPGAGKTIKNATNALDPKGKLSGALDKISSSKFASKVKDSKLVKAASTLKDKADKLTDKTSKITSEKAEGIKQAINNSSLGRKAAEYAEKASETSLGKAASKAGKDISSATAKGLNAIGKASSSIEKALKSIPVGKYTLGVAAGIITAGATGEVSKGVVAGMATQKLTGNLYTQLQSKRSEKSQIKHQEEELATAYEDYKFEHPEKTDEQITEECKAFLTENPEDYKDEPTTQRLINSLQRTESLYDDLGFEQPRAELSATVKQIQNGDIVPKLFNSKTLSMQTQRALNNFKNLSGYTEGQTLQFTLDIEEAINNGAAFEEDFLDQFDEENGEKTFAQNLIAQQKTFYKQSKTKDKGQRLLESSNAMVQNMKPIILKSLTENSKNDNK